MTRIGELLTNGKVEFYSNYDFNVARKLQAFIKVSERPHIQGNGHKFVFLRNHATGECAILTFHPTGTTVHICVNSNVANELYKCLR